MLREKHSLQNIDIYDGINNLPRFYNAKSIELIDKLSSVLTLLSSGLSYTMGSFFKGKNGRSTNLSSTLKESKYFKAWHREVEDTFDDLSEKVKEFIKQIALLAYKESNEDQALLDIVKVVTDPMFDQRIFGNKSQTDSEKVCVSLSQI